MIEIGRALLSLDVLEKRFACQISACNGGCCVDGDSGAPLEGDEANILDEIYPIVKPYLPAKGIEVIESIGTSMIDFEGDRVTPLVNNAECAFTVFDDKGIAKCGIEQAYFDNKISFRKPLSCHLYPIRIKSYARFDAVNFDKNDLCKAAEILGEKQGVPLYVFLKDALTRKYGQEWYEQLVYAAENLEID